MLARVAALAPAATFAALLMAATGPCGIDFGGEDVECERDSDCDDDEDCDDNECVDEDDGGEGEGEAPGEGEGEGPVGEGEGEGPVGEGEGEGPVGEGEGEGAPDFCAGFLGVDDGCDCGCGGFADADCGAGGCTDFGCSDAACEFCYTAAGDVPCDEPPPGACPAAELLVEGTFALEVAGSNYNPSVEDAADPCFAAGGRLAIIGFVGSDDGFALDSALLSAAGDVLESVEVNVHPDQWNASFCTSAPLNGVQVAVQGFTGAASSAVHCLTIP
jgi:hypothetical protein